MDLIDATDYLSGLARDAAVARAGTLNASELSEAIAAERGRLIEAVGVLLRVDPSGVDEQDGGPFDPTQPR